MGQQPNDSMEKQIFKERIQDIDYTPILSGIDIMYPPASIEHAKAEISKCGEKLKHKFKIQSFKNYKMTLGYIEDLEHGYSWDA